MSPERLEKIEVALELGFMSPVFPELIREAIGHEKAFEALTETEAEYVYKFAKARA